MATDAIYTKIAEVMEYEATPKLIKYLKVLFKPEEGEFLLNLATPITCKDLAKKLNVDEKDLDKKLQDYKRRRLLFHRKDEYLFHIARHGFFARIGAAKPEDIPEGFWKAWDDFMPEVEAKMIKQSLEVAKTIPPTGPMTRIVPAWLAMQTNKDVKPEDIIFDEDIHAQIREKGKTEVIAVHDCDCRKRAGRCDRPRNNCFEFGKYAEFNLNQSTSFKKISVEEALKISDEAEMGGLLKSGALMKRNGGVLCNCCECCCNVMGATIRTGTAHLLRSPSRWRARVVEEECVGCQACVDRCFFEAIEMKKVPGSKKMKAVVDTEKCMGCGLCVIGCEKKAMKFDLVHPPEYIQGPDGLPHMGERPIWEKFSSAP